MQNNHRHKTKGNEPAKRIVIKSSLGDSVNSGLMLNKLGLHHFMHKDILREEFDNTRCTKSFEIVDPVNNKRQKYDGDRQLILGWAEKSLTRLPQVYTEYFASRKTYLAELNSLEISAVTQSRFISGLSYGLALNSGFAMSHTHGVPTLPGSSVKGAMLAAAGGAGAGFDNIYGGKDCVGSVIFLDALPDSSSANLLEMDIMTPHHTEYYSGNDAYETAPDIENPIPVPFLAVRKGIKFHFDFIITEKDQTKRNKISIALKKHWQAAADEGFGTKTSSGYGWFEEFVPEKPECPVDKFETWLEQNSFDENNKGRHNLIINSINEIKGVELQDKAKNIVISKMKKKARSKSLNNFLVNNKTERPNS